MGMLKQHQGQYTLVEGKEHHSINRYDVHPYLRGLTSEQLHKFQQVGNRVRATRLNNGDIVVRPGGELKGGGGILATAIAVVGYPVVGVAAVATAIGVTVTTLNPLAGLAAGGGVATAGTAAVTQVVIIAAAAPTP